VAGELEVVGVGREVAETPIVVPGRRPEAVLRAAGSVAPAVAADQVLVELPDVIVDGLRSALVVVVVPRRDREVRVETVDEVADVLLVAAAVPVVPERDEPNGGRRALRRDLPGLEGRRARAHELALAAGDEGQEREE